MRQTETKMHWNKWIPALAMSVAAASATATTDSGAKRPPQGQHASAHETGPSGVKQGSHASAKASKLHGSRKAAPGVKRDPDGRIHRSPRARDDFKRTHPCPSTGRTTGACPGYVIDHVVPLKRGGADAPSNMQWQTKRAARAKDRTE
jgi:hypothetical protein